MQIYVLEGQEQKGPFTADELNQKIERGECAADCLAWREGRADWGPLADVLLAQDGSEEGQEESRLQPAANPPPLPQQETTPQERAWYDYDLVIFPAAICCFPIGLFPLCLTKRFETKIKVGISVALSVGYLAFLSFLVVLAALSGGADKEGAATRDRVELTDRSSSSPVAPSTTDRDAMEAAMEREAVKIASKIFGGRTYILGAEAAMYSKDAGGRFPLVVYVNRDYLDAFRNLPGRQTKEEFVFNALRKFFAEIKTSSAFAGVKNVFLAFGAQEFYDVYHVMGQSLPPGVLEFMLPMDAIKGADWERMSNSQIEHLFGQSGHFKVYGG